MSTKIAGLSSSYYFSCRARSDGKIGNSSLSPTIKRSKMIDQTRDLLNFSAQSGNSKVVSKPSNFRIKASANSPNSPSSSWKKWLLGIVLTVFLPAVGYKGGQLLYLKSKIDKAVETVEHVVEVVEEVAEEAERILEEVEEKLPDDSKLKKSLESFDELAKNAVTEAKKAEDIVHKVKDMEEELEETLIEAAKDKVTKPKSSQLPNKSP